MGCGASTVSKKSHVYDHQVLSPQAVSSGSADHHHSDTSDSNPAEISTSGQPHTNMSKAKKAVATKKETESPLLETLEQKIQSILSLPEEDAKAALTFASQHPHLLDEFVHFVNIMHDAIKRDAVQFVQQLHDIKGHQKLRDSHAQKHLNDFFALIGGVKVTAEVYGEQLKSMNIAHLTDELLDNEVEKEHADAMCAVQLMRFYWEDATDCSLEFAGKLAETDALIYLTEDLKHLEKSFRANSSVFDGSLTILHNCARNRQVKHLFRDIGAVQLLTPFLARKEKDIKLLALLTLSYIIDEEDNHLLFADASDFDFLLEAVSLAWACDIHRNPSGYSLEELLQGLGNLVQNDDNKRLLMTRDVLKQLKPILGAGSDGEKQEAAQIVWKLAFDKDNRPQMESDKELMDHLEKLKGSSHKGVAKSSGGALWILNMDKRVHKETGQGDVTLSAASIPPPTPPPPLSPPQSLKGGRLPAPAPPPPLVPQASPPPVLQKKGHVMISYQWGNQKTLLQISSNLRERGFCVWMDVDNISGSTLQAMAEAVEQSDAVLMCMSQRYKDSPNCRTEVEYAFALHKPIIPLLMERNYKPDGWLGILRGSKLFFDFSGKYPFDKKLEELVKELGHRGRSDSSEVDGPIRGEKARPVASAPVMSVSAWSQKDVHNWLNKHQLSGCLKLQSLSGENVNFLQKLSHRAPEFFFSYLKQDLGLTSLNDLMHFSDAIDTLP